MSMVNSFLFPRKLLSLLHIYLKPGGGVVVGVSPKTAHQPNLSLSYLLEELNKSPNTHW